MNPSQTAFVLQLRQIMKEIGQEGVPGYFAKHKEHMGPFDAVLRTLVQGTLKQAAGEPAVVVLALGVEFFELGYALAKKEAENAREEA